MRNVFELAGADGLYYKAKARIKNRAVVLSTKNVKVPKSVRFACENTVISNVFNGARLPASAFLSK